jgi:hypothetical protein
MFDKKMGKGVYSDREKSSGGIGGVPAERTGYAKSPRRAGGVVGAAGGWSGGVVGAAGGWSGGVVGAAGGRTGEVKRHRRGFYWGRRLCAFGPWAGGRLVGCLWGLLGWGLDSLRGTPSTCQTQNCFAWASSSTGDVGKSKEEFLSRGIMNDRAGKLDDKI